MAELRTNTNIGSVVEVRLEIWYVKTYTKNKSGWTLFHYGDNPPTSSIKNLVALCGNTMLVWQKKENGYCGFRVIGGNIQAKMSQTNEIVYFNIQEKQSNAKMVWLSENNIKTYLTKEKPQHFNEKALITIESEIRTFDSSITNQVFAVLKYNKEKIIITLNTPRNSIVEIIPNGKYQILSPDYSHAILYDENGNILGNLASQYSTDYPNMQNYDVWFPIEFRDLRTGKQDRYIHPGQISHGCVTVYDMNKWNDLFNYLISHRDINNNKYIGELEVRLER